MPKQKEGKAAVFNIRLTVTISEADQDLIKAIDRRLMGLGIKSNTSEIIRAGARSLDGLSDGQLSRLFKG